ncbi:hypothetical protein SKAU_G00392980 [Synaphobranchus kaupii]|uniref:NAD(P)(+)--arginine ADP-ribosyltransferase n=1 Tax=Synaphobranchus kaupii TaxID=118154 RepID=A0A9Q1IDT8_SYNKA|nr:hypothetical protein SKAU_G00392980 [Synaphobranchus kaupii]
MEVQREKVITLLIIATIMHTVDSEERQMDMSPNVVDDQFLGCREKMLEKVLGKGGLIEEERAANQMFSKAWDGATECHNRIQNGQPEHTRALVLYTHSYRQEFHSTFNNAMQSQGGNLTAYRGFPFKALHFLLTDALWILRPTSCVTVYHQSDYSYQARVGDKVRFGMFTSAISKNMLDESSVEDGGTLFTITSCAAVKVEDHACNPEEFELLIPPYEEFRVADVKDTEDYRVILLNHTRLYSNHDCFLFLNSGSSRDPVKSNLLLLLAASLCLCCSYV